MAESYIKAISYYLPSTVKTNDDLVKEFPEWTVEKIASKVGVNSRHLAGSESISDMATAAALNLFQENPRISREDIDFVILCTQSPDYILPPTACIVQANLSLSTNCGAFDFNLGCSGYEYGLAVAKGLVDTGIAKNVLFITSESYNKHIHPKDKGNKTIFGDAATATLISTDGFAKIGDFVLGTDGKGAENLIVRTGGSLIPHKLEDTRFDDNGNPISSDHLFMNGGEIFNFTLRVVPSMVRDTLSKNKLSKEDINLYVFHQANTFMLNHLRKFLRIDPDKFFINMENIGNTVSSTIPIALADAKSMGKLHGKVLIAGFGVGLSWGATILDCN
ncbi:MAG: ketoacyl-ACP synthase III [Muribaculaceae bacterium]|nr:ketoacyl-ACP synthase III [Muribaculaceae bacterium]